MTVEFEELIDAGLVSWTSETATGVDAIVARVGQHLTTFNQSPSADDQNRSLAAILGYQLPKSSHVNPPFQTDFGRHTFIGQNVFINRDVMLVDLGGVFIEDNALIGPRAMIISVNHREKPAHRRDLILKSVHIKKGAWIGAGAKVLPGVTVGENAIVGAGAIVTHDVPANMVVAGAPAKVIRPIKAQ